MDPAGATSNPFATIWTSPRATIRRIVDSNPRDKVLLLVVLGAVATATASAISGGNPTAFTIAGRPIHSLTTARWRYFQMASLLGSPLLAIPFLYFSGALYRWSGALIGGAATAVEVRASIAWSTIPAIAGSLLQTLIGVLIHPAQPPPPTNLHAMLAASSHYLFVNLPSFILFGWAFIVWLKCLAEVHRFSAWRALAAFLIALLTEIGGVVVLVAIGLVAIVPFLR